MRILYFTRDFTPHDHRFLTALAETEHQIYSLRLERRGRLLEDRPLPDRIEQVDWKGGQGCVDQKQMAELIPDLKQVIDTVTPDVVHAGPIQNAAHMISLTGFKPLVSMSWGSDLLVDADSSREMREITRRTLNKTSVLVGDCMAVKRKAKSFGFDGDRVVLFPWGVDLGHFSPKQKQQNSSHGASDLRQRLGWEDAFVLLSLRSWEPIYGVDVLVKAFIKAAEMVPELRLLMLGGGTQAEMLRSMLSQAGMLDRVFFGGKITNEDLPEFYRDADLYLSSSHSDGSSVSLMEALACGCPVLVSDIPGNLEWIEDGKQGWLFPDGDVDAFSNRMMYAFKNQRSLEAMGTASRTLAEARADWPRNFKKLLAAYDLAARLVND